MSKLQIIMYHYVRDLQNSRYPNIRGLSDKNFMKQIDYLEANYTLVTPQDVIEAYNGGRILPSDACLLTFDDGYSDHFNTVFPVLENRGIKGFFSMPGRILEEEKLLDVNKIHYILAASDLKQVWMIFVDRLKAILRDNNLPSYEEYWENCNLTSRFDPPEIIFIKRMLQVELPIKIREEFTDWLYEKIVDVPENVMVRELYMSREQMKLMKKSGMVFGIHGYEHAWLNRMTFAEAEDDIKKALDAMDGIVDKDGWIICYPYGSYSKQVEEIAKKKGAVLGITTKSMAADTERDGVFSLPRLDTNDFPPISSKFKELQ